MRAALGDYAHTLLLKSGTLKGGALPFEFVPVAPIHRAFAPMVREGRFEVSEMAIATFLQAKSVGKDLVLLPITMAARFQEGALLCRVGGVAGPADLGGRRVGVRAYSQTTGMWLRGILADDYGVPARSVRWVTFEDAHVAEYRDPAWAERAPAGSDMMAMLRGGELDAVIVGNDVPADPGLRTVFPDPAAAGEAFWRKHGFVPVNHLVAARLDLAERHPEALAGLVRAVRDAKAALPAAERDALPIGCEALRPAIGLALRYAGEQGLLGGPLDAESVWSGLPAAIRESCA